MDVDAMSKLQRYEWEDAIVEAGTLNLISTTSVNFALRISRQINWTPRKNKPLGLNWKNALAYESVGLSESSGKRGKKNLMENGFIEINNGNIVPTMPDNVETLHSEYAKHLEELKVKHLHQKDTGQKEPSRGQKEPTAGQIDPSEGQIDLSAGQKYPPFTEDQFTEDQLTEDQFLAAAPRNSSGMNDDSGQTLLSSEANEVAGEARNDPKHSLIAESNENAAIASDKGSARGQIDLSTEDKVQELRKHIAELEATDTSSMGQVQALAVKKNLKIRKQELDIIQNPPDEDEWL